MDITAIGVGVSIASVLMPISLRLVDFIIHLGRRWMQVRHIRKLVKADLTSILNDDPANLTVRSTNPGKVGEVKSVGTDYLADARRAYFKRMMRNLELAMCDFSSDLSHKQKRDMRICLSSHPDFINQWIERRNGQMPTLDVYERIIIVPMEKIKWLKTEKHKSGE